MKFYKRTRYPYWSETKLFSWMLPEKPVRKFTTVDEMRKSLEIKDPLLERFIDRLQDIVMFPSDFIYSARIYLKNSKGNTHVLEAGLNRGEWYDLVYRIPRCLFSELEKFIEVEKGLETHEWEKTLTFNENWGVKTDDEKYGKLTPQALAAIEQDEIYKWWKSVKDRGYIGTDEDDTYQEQEQEMLIRLVKIYRSLWT